MENPFNNNGTKEHADMIEDSNKTGTPKLPNKMPKSPKKHFQEMDPDSANPSINKVVRSSKKVAFASSSKIIESGSGSHRRSSNKSYLSDNQDQYS